MAWRQKKGRDKKAAQVQVPIINWSHFELAIKIFVCRFHESFFSDSEASEFNVRRKPRKYFNNRKPRPENISMISIRIFVEWWNLLNRWRCRNEGRICVIVTSKESPTVQILNCTEFRCHSPRVDQIEEGVLLFRSLTIRCWFARDANFNLKANPRCKLCGSFCGGRRESLTLSFLCSLLFPCYLIKSFSSENWVPLTSLCSARQPP